MIIDFGISTVGKSHIKKGTCCQDSHYIKTMQNGWVIAAVADGVGSAKNSHIGSKIAAETVVEFCDECMPWDFNIISIKSMMRTAYNYAFKQILRESQQSGEPIESYDTTLSMVIYDGQRIIYGHSGDGAIFGLTTFGDYVEITRPQKSADGVSVIPLRGGYTQWVIDTYEEDLSAVLLMTDGMLETLCHYLLRDHEKKTNRAYIPLMTYFADPNGFDVDDFKKIKKEIIIYLITIVILCTSFYATISLKFMQNKYQVTSNKELFNYPSNPTTTVNEFGVNGFLILDVKSLFWGQNENTIETPAEEEIINQEKQFDDTIWNQIIENETNKTYKELSEYFISRSQGKTNEYTGLFKGKNLILIMLESVNEIAINEEYFPTLYKIYSEGWSWKNNYSPRNTCPTGNNEFSALTSLYSINNTCTAREYQNNTYYESLFNLFNNKGYTTKSFHNYTDQYYKRTTIHKNLGSTYYGPSKLGIKTSSTYGVWPSDVDLIKKSYEIFSTEEQYFTFMTTVTSHTPYNQYSEYGNKYLDKFKDLKIPTDLKRYLSKLTEVDLALQTLIEKLEENGELDNTVIAIFGDHYPYAISQNTLQKMLDYNVVDTIDIDKTPFAIYTPSIEPKVFEEYTSYINILPTLANLFGLDYDTRLYMGEDLLSEDYESIVIFPNGTWKNEVAYYNANNNKITYFNEEVTYTDEEIININKMIASKLQHSTTSIKKNYFNYLKNKYTEYGIENPIGLYLEETK